MDEPTRKEIEAVVQQIAGHEIDQSLSGITAALLERCTMLEASASAFRARLAERPSSYTPPAIAFMEAMLRLIDDEQRWLRSLALRISRPRGDA